MGSIDTSGPHYDAGYVFAKKADGTVGTVKLSDVPAIGAVLPDLTANNRDLGSLARAWRSLVLKLSMVFVGTTFKTTVTAADPGADRALILPDASGTVATQEYVTAAVVGAGAGEAAVRAATAGLSTSLPMNAQKIIELANGSAAQDAATLANIALAVVSNTDKTRQIYLGALSAPAAVHAQFAAGSAIDASTVLTAAPHPCRTVQVARGGAGVATVYTITGTHPITGAVQTEVINSNGATTVQGTKAWGSVTRIQSDVNPTVTTDVQWGKGFCLDVAFISAQRLSSDETTDTIASSDPDTGTLVATTAPNAAHVFRAKVTVRHTHTLTP